MKRIMALLLCLALTLGMCTVLAWAADEPVEEEGTVSTDLEEDPSGDLGEEMEEEGEAVLPEESDMDLPEEDATGDTEDTDDMGQPPEGSEQPIVAEEDVDTSVEEEEIVTDGDSAEEESQLPFEDVSPSAWYYGYVQSCYEQGLMYGRSTTLFVPNGTSTRAEMVSVLYRIAGEPTVSSVSVFEDVASDAWYAQAVYWAYRNGLVKGDGDGSFRPNDSISREELVVILYRFAVRIGLTEEVDSADTSALSGFQDAAAVSSWAIPAEVWSVESELQVGDLAADGNYYLAPSDAVLRSALAVFLVRISADAGDLTMPPEDEVEEPLKRSGLEVEDYECASQTTQIIDVKASGNTGTLTLYEIDDGMWTQVLTTSCYVGKNGISSNKKEGDGKTPSGVYTLGQAFGVAADPGSTRAYLKLTTYHYWVDDTSSIYYNQLVDSRVTGIKWSSAEHLIDYTTAYKYAIAIDYNTACVSGAGSAIFLHCSTGNATAGCVSVSESVMKTILQSLRDDTLIYIH